MLNLEQRLRTQLDAFPTRSSPVEANSPGDGGIICDAHGSSLPAEHRHENLAQGQLVRLRTRTWESLSRWATMLCGASVHHAKR